MRGSSLLPMWLMVVNLIGPMIGLSEAQTTIRVPADEPTIQGAINAVVNGDIVLVGPGTYVENIDFFGKAITVEGEGGTEVTIIDGNQAGPVVTFSSGEGHQSVLRGFTITNGHTYGIKITEASPTIEDNIITNIICTVGSAIHSHFGSPVIRGNRILFNGRDVIGDCGGGPIGGAIGIVGNSSAQIVDTVIANNYGFGITLFAAGPTIIRGNVISWNEAGGIEMVNDTSGTQIVQNLIVANRGRGIIHAGSGGILYVNNTIAYNDASAPNDSSDGLGSELYKSFNESEPLSEFINNIVIGQPGQTAIYCEGATPQTFDVRFSNVSNPLGIRFGGSGCTDQTGEGNIAADPLFVAPLNFDYHLTGDSPSIDTGENTQPHLPSTDFEGQMRILDGDGNGSAVVDMGVDEFSPTGGAPGGILDFADLVVTMTDSMDPVPLGQSLTYSMTVTNAGPKTALGVLLVNTLPSDVTFGSATPSKGTCTENSGLVTCALGSLANGASASVLVTGTPTAPAVVTNAVRVQSLLPDPIVTNNVTTESTISGPVTLTLSILGDGAGQISYSVAGEDCISGTCTTTVPAGTSILLTAIPAAGSSPAGWGGDSDCYDGHLTMNTNKTCLATFVLGSPTANSSEYFPTDSGRMWSYLENGSVPYTITVLPGTVSVNGVPTKVLHDSRDGYQEFYTSDAAGIRLHRQFFPQEFIPGIGTVNLTVTYVPPILLAKGVATIGETVVSSGTGITNSLPTVGVVTLAYTASFTAQAFDRLHVPAGPFNTIRFQGTITIDGEPTGSTFWAARNVGMVKQIGDGNLIELTAATPTISRNLFDLNGDDKADILWRNTSTTVVAAWLMNGTTLVSPGFFGGVPAAWEIQGIGDVDGNGNADVVWKHASQNVVAIWMMNGLTISTVGFPGGVSAEWEIQEVGDINGDGKADLLWRNTSSGVVAIWLMNGPTIASPGFLGGVPSEWQIKGLGDVNGDGKADVIWQHAMTGTVAVWIMNGFTITSVGFPGSTSTDWKIEGIGDFNGDGKADLIWKNETSNIVVIWLMNGTSIMSTGVLGGIPSALDIEQVGDMNGDGKADVVLKNNASGAVTIWLMNGVTVVGTGSPGSTVSTEWEIQP